MIGDGDFGVFFNPNDFAVPAVFHLPSGDITVNAIFKNPSERADVKSGGFIDSTKPSLLVSSVEASGIERRHTVTVQNKHWLVVFVEPDGTGMTEIFLGASDGNQSEQSSIRY